MKLTWAQRIGTALFVIFVLTALFGPMLVTDSPTAIDGDRLMKPSARYWLGTNTIGQNLFSQLIYGARTTLIIGGTVSLISTVLSVFLGLLAGYSKRFDLWLNGLANMLLVLPSLLLVLIVASFTGGSTWQLIMTLGLLSWPGYMRIIRSSVLSLKEREFVRAAELYKGSTLYILRRHLLPFIGPLIRTKLIIAFQYAVAAEASLSFLGIGDPSTVSWGKMLQDAFSRTQTFLSGAWLWAIVPPAGAIVLVIIALALLGEAKQTGSLFAARLSHRRRVGRRSKVEKGMSPAESTDRENEEELAAVSVHNLKVAYGERTIVHPLSFEVKQGSITSLVGESGSGKTTTARAVYGLVPEEAVEGSVLLNGHALYASQEGNGLMQRWIDAAYIVQDPRTSFNPIMTIGQQFYEVMKLQENKSEKKLAAIAALQEVQLDARVLKLYPHQLSGGMLSRAMIALALVNKPKVLIADEPTGALDPIVKREVFELLVSKVREYRMAMLLITHDLPAARHISDEIIVLHEGKRLDPIPQLAWINSLAGGKRNALFGESIETVRRERASRSSG